MDGVTLPAAGADAGEKSAAVVVVANIAGVFADIAVVVRNTAVFFADTATVGVVFEKRPPTASHFSSPLSSPARCSRAGSGF